jgi:hypothetical protein
MPCFKSCRMVQFQKGQLKRVKAMASHWRNSFLQQLSMLTSRKSNVNFSIYSSSKPNRMTRKPRRHKSKCLLQTSLKTWAFSNFVGKQPCKAYYLSPLNAFVFGVVDCSLQKTTLSVHTYFETDGKKGSNNVASMLWKELTRKGLTTIGEKVTESNIIMDNCAGQNKNRMVIRLLFFSFHSSCASGLKCSSL